VATRGGVAGDPAVLEAVARLAPELEALARERAAAVPLGLIHGDLFVDNVLYSASPGGETLLALLDFEQASWGRLIYDVAVTLLAFTFGRDDFRPELVTAFLTGYRSERRLEDSETQVLGAELRFAAARFAITRITDVHLKRTLGAPGGKDFRRYLLRLARVQERLRRDPAAFLG
jgi:homoserine kinase type II